jgi:hypothetical protein
MLRRGLGVPEPIRLKNLLEMWRSSHYLNLHINAASNLGPIRGRPEIILIGTLTLKCARRLTRWLTRNFDSNPPYLKP